jgi:site-specific DNA recombinase
VSTENQLENYSIPEQKERLEAYCKAKGWSIYKIYPDAGFSGGNIDRPALQQMLKDIRLHRLDMVAVYKLDRLSRSQKDTLTLIEDEFIANGVEFVSMSENFDTSTAFGRAMIGILSVFAQLEKDQITERFTMGRIGRSKAGYFHGGGNAPRGYDYIDGKLVVNEFMAKQVQEVYQQFLTGESINSIYKDMHEKYGGWNSSRAVLNTLKNSVYIGKVKFKGKSYDGVQDHIISDADYNQVQKLLRSSAREEAKTSAQKTPFRAGYLLSSLVYCARCGARYSANHGYYKCYSRSKSSQKFITDPNCKNTNYKIEELDAAVIAQINRLQYDKDYFNEVVGKPRSTKDDTKALSDRLVELDRQISRMLDLYQVGTIPIEQISSRLQELQSKRDTVKEKLISVQQGTGNGQKEEFIKALKSADDILNSDSLEKKRLLLSTMIESIWIDGESVEISWRI